MENKTIRKFKWFWAWQDEAEEDWLREKANEGWHLTNIGFPTIYSFKAGEAKDFIYRLDYRSHYKMEKEDYLQLFRDSGWEYVEEMAGWHYFRQLARPGEELEIYTDAESKIGKYQRLLMFLGILTLPLILITINMNYGFSSIIQVMIFLLFVLYVYAIIRILIRIRELKRI